MSAVVSPSSDLFLSVIVPTYKREVELCTTLQDMLAQDYPHYEILVVDQTPRHDESTQAFLDALPADRVRRIQLDSANLPAARNVGLREAHADVVVFVDDDVRLAPGFLRAHARNYDDPGIEAVAGPILGPSRETRSELPVYRRHPYAAFYTGCWQYDKPRDVQHAPGGNMSFRKRLAEKAGYFDEHYTGPGFREESDFFLRATLSGARIVYDPACELIHTRGATDGGCWTGYDGVPSAERYYNHAYFVLKNFPRRAWPALFWDAFRGALFRREVLRNPLGHARSLVRFYAGWRRAWREAPRLNMVGKHASGPGDHEVLIGQDDEVPPTGGIK